MPERGLLGRGAMGGGGGGGGGAHGDGGGGEGWRYDDGVRGAAVGADADAAAGGRPKRRRVVLAGERAASTGDEGDEGGGTGSRTPRWQTPLRPQSELTWGEVEPLVEIQEVADWRGMPYCKKMQASDAEAAADAAHGLFSHDDMLTFFRGLVRAHDAPLEGREVPVADEIEAAVLEDGVGVIDEYKQLRPAFVSMMQAAAASATPESGGYSCEFVPDDGRQARDVLACYAGPVIGHRLKAHGSADGRFWIKVGTSKYGVGDSRRRVFAKHTPFEWDLERASDAAGSRAHAAQVLAQGDSALVILPGGEDSYTQSLQIACNLRTLEIIVTRQRRRLARPATGIKRRPLVVYVRRLGITAATMHAVYKELIAALRWQMEVDAYERGIGLQWAYEAPGAAVASCVPRAPHAYPATGPQPPPSPVDSGGRSSESPRHDEDGKDSGVDDEDAGPVPAVVHARQSTGSDETGSGDESDTSAPSSVHPPGYIDADECRTRVKAPAADADDIVPWSPEALAAETSAEWVGEPAAFGAEVAVYVAPRA